MPLKLIVRENGSLAIDVTTGDFEIVDHLGNSIPVPQPKPGKTTIALCRCGLSANKPFCDSTHKRAEWRAHDPARDGQPPAPPKPPA